MLVLLIHGSTFAPPTVLAPVSNDRYLECCPRPGGDELFERLSTTVREQRKQMASSLGTLKRELTAFVDTPPSSAGRDELSELKESLARAKRDEASMADEVATPTTVQRLRMELALANDECAKRSAQVKSLEYELKARDEGDKALRHLEAELERRAAAYEATRASPQGETRDGGATGSRLCGGRGHSGGRQ